MIKGFEQPHPAEPLEKTHLQSLPALGAGLIAGVILLILPHASPWSGLTAFTPTILGRLVPATWDLAAFGVILLHLALSVVYGFLISLAVVNIREMKAVLVGGIVGLVLYFINLGIVSMWLPAMRGSEVSIIVTHVVFGLVVAGAYRGLLRRKAVIN